MKESMPGHQLRMERSPLRRGPDDWMRLTMGLFRVRVKQFGQGHAELAIPYLDRSLCVTENDVQT